MPYLCAERVLTLKQWPGVWNIRSFRCCQTLRQWPTDLYSAPHLGETWRWRWTLPNVSSTGPCLRSHTSCLCWGHSVDRCVKCGLFEVNSELYKSVDSDYPTISPKICASDIWHRVYVETWREVLLMDRPSLSVMYEITSLTRHNCLCVEHGLRVNVYVYVAIVYMYVRVAIDWLAINICPPLI